jgi:hypothetical protein
MEHGGARSYLDALSEYERVTQDAIALARRKSTPLIISPQTPRDLDLDGLPEPEAIREVMLRWHHSLVAVLETSKQFFQDPLELTTADEATGPEG